MVSSDFRAEVEIWLFRALRNASGHNYRNSLFIVELAMGQLPHSTECISSFSCSFIVHYNLNENNSTCLPWL